MFPYRQLAQVLPSIVGLVEVPKGRVLRHMNTLHLVPLRELSLLQPRMHLHLMHSRWYLPLLVNPLDFSLIEVAHSNGLHLSRVKELLHRLPRIEVIDLRRLHLAIRILRHQFRAGFEGPRPMHQVEIDVVGLQSFEGVIESWFDILWCVGVVPELGGYEEGFAVYSGSFDGFCNCRFRAVDVCRVNVFVLL